MAREAEEYGYASLAHSRIGRFSERYMFQLTDEENLKFQNGISRWGGSRTLPYAFTEQSVAMLSSVLHTYAAIQVSIIITDAFVAMRRYVMTKMHRLRNLKQSGLSFHYWKEMMRTISKR